jgi:HTH-type transcriptional regulator/antitoxin MqsA
MTLIDEVRAWRLPSVKTRRAIRLAAGVSQSRMAEELGVHRLTFVRWESGKHEPRGENRKQYAELLVSLRQVTA